MEIVSDADECEALLEEFANASGSEKEQAEDDVILVCGRNQVLGRLGDLG